MAVLAVFEGFVTVRANGLLRTGMDASKADGAAVADEGFVVGQADIGRWANTDAGVAADTLIGVHLRA